MNKNFSPKIEDFINSEKNKEKKTFFRNILESFSNHCNHMSANVLNDLDKLFEMKKLEKKIDGSYCEDGEKKIIKIFLKNNDCHLSKMMNIFDNLSIDVLNHVDHKAENFSIHEFEISNRGISIKENFFEIFEKLMNDEWIFSLMNKLTIFSDLNLRQIKLLVTIKKYLKQVSRRFDHDIMEALTFNHHEIFKKFFELFDLRLNPNLKPRSRLDKINEKKAEIDQYLNSIVNLNDFQALKVFYEVLLSIVRTNFYQNHEYISIKTKPKLLSFLTDVQAYAEVFVFSKDFEAIHLRGTKVSRGGLRWSDRRDYRSEVLGLMRAQMKKNTITIPSGAKGGFYITNKEKAKDSKFVIFCYQTFLCGMLDVTDNLDEHNKILHPENVIIAFDYKDADEESDSYVVAAADKGTGTFSDYANEISEKYNFWLGDAFASGGSNGYDHKELAITSRGAGITVEKLFHELGKNIKESEFTAIGIGDMAGDVFGNGMLLWKNIRMIAAFNHMHIFVDPNPDVEKSYKERERMFKLKGSTWMDYNQAIISQGGGIFSRNEKLIEISKEIGQALDIPQNISSLTPDELIKYILKSKAELLWNGGIGTFVKSELESHEEVVDKSNDNIRVNGCELRVRVVGEGGNLGFTQLGRVEAARSGVRINTDFIDNSAGVSCSDREVNLKILFFQILTKKKITLEERNKMLKNMRDEVCTLVLKDNVLQNNALMIEESYKFSAFDRHVYLIENLEKEKILNRKSENLPNDSQIEKLKNAKQSFTRPELAILLTYTKIWLKKEILNSDITENKYFEKFLIGYFPKSIQENFKEFILNHPLRRDIITNYIVNTLINRVGMSFIFNIMNKTGKTIIDIVYAYFIIRDSYKLRDIWHDVEYSHEFNEIDSKIKSLLEIRKFAEQSVCWYLQQHSKIDHSNLEKNILEFREKINEIMENFQNLGSKKNNVEYRAKISQFLKQGLKSEFAEKLARIRFLIFAPSLIEIHKKMKVELNHIVKIYFLIEDKLELRNVRRNVMNWKYYTMSQESSVSILVDNVTNEHLRILKHIVSTHFVQNGDENLSINIWQKEHINYIENYLEVARKIHYNSEIDYSHIVLLIDRMNKLYK
jgi:glutamate dehydrogenase